MPIILTIVAFIVIYFVGQNIPHELIETFVKSTGPVGPAIVVALFLAAYTFAPLSGSPLLLAGYYLYGVDVILISYVAAVVSFAINFWIARKLGREYVEKLIGQKRRKDLDRFMNHKGSRTVILLRFLAGAFQDVISYAMGLTKIRFYDYYLASIAGSLPGTIIWYLAAKQTTNIEQFVGVNIILVGFFFIAWLVINKFFKLI